MTRDIKFRAWDEIEKEFANTIGMDLSMLSLSTRYKFQQFTGLKDKNDIEIYEGDIVKGTEDNEHQGYSNVFIDTWNIQPFSYLDCYNTSLFEVIGNIYENPELLEDK